MGRTGPFNVRDYGAVGDGKTLDSPAINKAIEACAAAGGGTVWIPAGTYLSGSIRLTNNLNLHIDAGATILAAPASMNAYDPTEELGRAGLSGRRPHIFSQQPDLGRSDSQTCPSPAGND